MRIINVFVLLLLAGCVDKIGHHGKIIFDKDLAKIIIHKSNKEEVYNIIGSSTMAGSWKANDWIYIYKKNRYFLLNSPKEIESTVVTITFNSKDIVQNIQVTNSLHARSIVPLADKTKSVDAKSSIFGGDIRPGIKK